MIHYNPSNHHFAYMDKIRHWHPPSERYTGGDSLLTALRDGWEVAPVVTGEAHWYAGTRCVMVYCFEFSRGGETMVMPVIANPYVVRLIAENDLRVTPVVQGKFARTG